jgi:hypothetical protein
MLRCPALPVALDGSTQCIKSAKAGRSFGRGAEALPGTRFTIVAAIRYPAH